MPPDPTTTVPPDEHMDTEPGMIGHVAPDFSDRKLFNTLVIRPEYRISLRLGDFEDLFADAANTPKGRMARMQVLGLFYFPLKHSKAATAFTQTWDHYKKKILANVSDDDADKDIQERLKKWIVDAGTLPSPADDPDHPAAGNFGKLRFPGAFSFVNALDGAGEDRNKDAAYPMLDFGKEIFDVEEAYVKDNEALHRIPLVARVEKRDPASAQWQPVKDAWVYFQLVKPYKDLPAFDPAADVTGQINRPDLRNSSIGPNWTGGDKATAGSGGNFGPKGYSKAKDPVDPDGTPHTTGVNNLDSNPQALNCPKDYGGKNGKGNANDGSDVNNIIFLTSEIDHFNKGTSATHKPLPKAQGVSPDGNKHKHSVKAKTNEDGEAGVIFLPGRFGGDRYRIRAYVGPDTVNGPGDDGTGVRAVAVDTGTMVVWRSIRVSRYIRQEADTTIPQILRDDLKTHQGVAAVSDSDYRWYFCFDDNSTHAEDSTFPSLDLSTAFQTVASPGAGVGAMSGPYDRAGPQFARAFCQLEFDQGSGVEAMTLDDWKAAVRAALDSMSGHQASLGLNLDIDKLFYWDKINDGTITQRNCMVHLPMRSPESYNTGTAAARQITATQNLAGTITNMVSSYGWGAFIAHFTRDGRLPGLTVMQAGFGTTWQGLVDPALTTLTPRWGGMATEYRGAFDWFGGRPYPNTIWITDAQRGASDVGRANATYSYDYTTTCCHEMGHLLYRKHAPGRNRSDPNAEGGGNDPAMHDPLAQNICLMAYKKCEGQFCAKCLFAFRGWKLANLSESTP